MAVNFNKDWRVYACDSAGYVDSVGYNPKLSFKSGGYVVKTGDGRSMVAMIALLLNGNTA